MFARRCFLALVAVVAVGHVGFAAAAKKKDKDDVNGATWRVIAENVKTKETKEFRFRAKDNVLFNAEGKKVGAIKVLGETTEGGRKSRLTWLEPLPLTGAIVITQSKVGRWGGRLTTEAGDEWTCRMDKVDK